jgi:hypothetical protein
MLSIRYAKSFYTYLPSTASRAPCLILSDGSTLTSRPNTLASHVNKLSPASIDESLLPPRVHNAGRKDFLTPSEIQEATELRKSDPMKWSVRVLADKFGVDREYVKLRISISKDYAMALEEKTDGEFEGMQWVQKRRVLTRLRKRMAW